MSKKSDCLEEIRRGDRKAFQSLILSQSDRLYRLARRITGDPALAEDVVQETFLKILSGRIPPRRIGRDDAWLSRVAVRTAIDLVRKRETRARREGELAMVIREHDHRPVDVLAETEDSLLVAEGFAALSLETRAAIWLHVVEGESARRVGECLGLRMRTVSRRIQSGLEELREFLRRRGFPAVAALPTARLIGQLPADRAPEGLLARLQGMLDPWPPPASGPGGPLHPTSADGPSLLKKGVSFMAGEKMMVSIAVSLALLLGLLFDPLGLLQRPPIGPGAQERKVAAPTPPIVDQPTQADRGDQQKDKKAPGIRPPSSAVTSPSGTVLVRVRWGSDGDPAAGVHITLINEMDSRLFFRKTYQATTGTDGSARLVGIPPGNALLQPDRCSISHVFWRVRVKVKDGETTEAEMEIPAGISVMGIVVDRAGAPVKGARIWLGTWLGNPLGDSIAETGPDGRFTIRDVERRYVLAARASGFAPSEPLSIAGEAGSSIDVKVVLDRKGGALAGRVVDSSGRPVEGAWVRIGSVQLEQGSAPMGRNVEGFSIFHPPLLLLSDQEGRFRGDGVEPGEVAVAVRTLKKYIPWEGSAEIAPAKTAELEVVLEEGASLAGTILEPTGKPASWIQVGVVDQGDPFLSQFAYTAPDGTYRIEGLPPGELEVRAGSNAEGMASGKIKAAAGEEVRWDAVLSGGDEIVVRVLDENEKPLKAVSVKAYGELGSDVRGAKHDGEGRFRIPQCKEPSYTVGVYVPQCGYPSVHIGGVHPGGPEAVLRLPESAHPSAFFQGNVLGPDGKVPKKLQVCIQSVLEQHTGIRPCYSAEGTFKLGPYPPGRYCLAIGINGEEIQHKLGERELTSGQTLDLGTIRIGSGGSLDLTLIRKGGASLQENTDSWILEVADEDDQDWRRWPTAFNGEVGNFRWDGLQAGKYTLHISGQHAVAGEYLFEVSDSETTRLVIELPPGATRTLRFVAPEGSRPSKLARVKVQDGAGKTVFDRSWRQAATGLAFAPSESRTIVSDFSAGVYSVEAITDTGLRADGKFEVKDDLVPENEDLEFQLR